MIKCDLALKIWLTDSKCGIIMQDEPALMRCPYPENLTYIDGKFREHQQLMQKERESPRQPKLAKHIPNFPSYKAMNFVDWTFQRRSNRK